ncbi:MAG: acyl-CoA dehydrogenase family protein [Dehalococcoidia bacterium]
MDFRLPPDTLAWRNELRAFLRDELPAGFHGSDDFFDDAEQVPFAKEFMRRLGDRRWLTPGWERRYGGMGKGPIEQFILNEELAYARAPHGGRLFTIGITGPTILHHATGEQKDFFLPRMASGQDWWCQGFSEPGSGSDLASLQTTAVRDGDDYVINGQKIWSSNAQHADWMMVLARTDPDVPKHKGITAFAVDMRAPGVSLSPIDNIAYRQDFNATFFDNVRVPAANILGGLNTGWYVAATTLDFERSNIAAISGAKRTVHDLICWAKSCQGGKRAWDDPKVRHTLSDLLVDVEVGRLLAFRTVWLQAKGAVPNAEASIGKVFMADLGMKVSNAGVNLLGMYGQLTHDSDGAPLDGRVLTSYLLGMSGPIGGGTKEIQKNIIATRGIGLPRG